MQNQRAHKHARPPPLMPAAYERARQLMPPARSAETAAQVAPEARTPCPRYALRPAAPYERRAYRRRVRYARVR